MKKQNTLWNRMVKYRMCYLMIAPFIILFAIFIIIPIAGAFVLSFTDFNMLEMPGFVGFENYTKLFLDDDVFLIAVKNTLVFAIITDRSAILPA